MASIQNVILQIVENQGAAAALVTYSLFGSPDDLQQRRTYIETIELIGVDQGPHEDGRDEFIADGRSTPRALTFPLATPAQSRLMALPAARLNEDSSAFDPPHSPDFDPDEIRARVTLGISAESNTVVLHDIVIVNAPTPA